jgi:hypothetical protein
LLAWVSFSALPTISYPSTKMKHAACCAWEGSRLAGKWADFGIDRYRIEIASFVIR